MKHTLGIVAEFNPFHNGHQWLILQGRKAGYTHCVIAMSGNFVQRAQLALAEKRVRTAAALQCGADLVLELPVAFATSGAQRFAGSAVHLLAATGCVDALCFGSESGDISELEQLSALLDKPEISVRLPHYLGQGMGFAKARALAVADLHGEALARLLDGPNNLLGLEYLRANRKLTAPLRTLTFPRAGAAHDHPAAQGKFASASFLRGLARGGSDISAFVPRAAAQQYQAARGDGLFPTEPERLHTAMLSALRRLPREAFSRLPDLSEGLEDRLYHAVRAARTLPELESLLKTKRYPTARVRRLMLHAFLGVEQSHAELAAPYLRVLGCNANGRELLRDMSRSASLPVSASLARLRGQNDACRVFAELEARTTDQFALALPRPLPCGYDFTAQAIFLP